MGKGEGKRTLSMARRSQCVIAGPGFRGILTSPWRENPLSEEEGQGEACAPKQNSIHNRIRQVNNSPQKIYITLCRCLVRKSRLERCKRTEVCGDSQLESWGVCQFDGGDPRRGKVRREMGDGGFMVFVVGYFFGDWDLSGIGHGGGGDRPIVKTSA
jgi:hypothetical protein